MDHRYVESTRVPPTSPVARPSLAERPARGVYGGRISKPGRSIGNPVAGELGLSEESVGSAERTDLLTFFFGRGDSA